jgi:hypothetical protein
MDLRFFRIFIFFLLIASTARAQHADIIDTITGYFKVAETEKLSALFSSPVELNILSEENSYSRAQAELIMRNFFSKNKPASIKVIHRLTSNPNYKLAVLSMQTAKDKFRISISLRNSGEKLLIREIRIEYDKQ